MTMFRFQAAVLAMAFCAAALAAPPDLSHVNGAIEAQANQRYGKLSTVNGAIRIHSGVEAASASTVNGSITIDRDARIGSLGTVNGSIRAGESVTLGEDASTVNGAVEFGDGSTVGGSLQTVNGRITLAGTTVGGDIETVGGNLLVGRGSRVDGDVHVKPAPRRLISWGRESSRVPRVVIGPEAEVRGRLRFEREVELYIHESARTGEIDGAEAVRFSGEEP